MMKKTFSIATVILLIPFSVFAKNIIPDNGLHKVTGQAGMSIDVDLTFDITLETAYWRDDDGLGVGSGTTEGWVGLKNFSAKNTKIYSAKDPLTQEITKMAIDVVTEGAANASGHGEGTTYVRISMGSLAIDMEQLQFDVGLGSSKRLEQNLGSVYLGGLKLLFNKASRVDILTVKDSKASGIGTDLDLNIESLKLDALSWGNSKGNKDGVSDLAGYFGLSGLSITTLKIVGPLTINVATNASDATTLQSVPFSVFGPGVSYVHIGLGSDDSRNNTINTNDSSTFAKGALGVSMTSFNADVKIADNKQLTGGGTCGSLAVSHLMLGVNGWIRLAGH